MPDQQVQESSTAPLSKMPMSAPISPRGRASRGAELIAPHPGAGYVYWCRIYRSWSPYTCGHARCAPYEKEYVR